MNSSNQCRRHFPESGKVIASPFSCPWCQIELLRSALQNISTVKPLDHFPAVTALAYCREKAIEALSAKPAYGHETEPNAELAALNEVLMEAGAIGDSIRKRARERIAQKATPDAYKATCEGGSGGPCTQPDCEKCWPDEELIEHLYVPRSSGNDQCMACGKPKSECSAVNGRPPHG